MFIQLSGNPLPRWLRWLVGKVTGGDFLFSNEPFIMDIESGRPFGLDDLSVEPHPPTPPHTKITIIINPTPEDKQAFNGEKKDDRPCP